MKMYPVLILASLLLVSCATGPYKHVKGDTDLSSMEEVLDSIPTDQIELDKQVSYNFLSTTSPHVFFADRQYRTTAKPYVFQIAENGTYEIKVQTMLPAIGKTINMPYIEIYNNNKEKIDVKKTSQFLKGPGFIDNASLITLFETDLSQAGKYYLIASSDLTKKDGIIIDIVNEYGAKTGQVKFNESPYSTYRITISKKIVAKFKMQ